MKKPLYIVICALMLAFCAGALGACENNGHSHVFSDKWNSTADSHWHYCTVSGCNVRGDEAEHSDWTLVETISAPSCYASGEGVFACGVCGYKTEMVIPPTDEHVYADEWEYSRGSDRHFKRCTVRGCTARLTEPHTPGELTLRAVATMFEDGYSSVECTECGMELSRVIRPANGVAHSFDFGLKKGISTPGGTVNNTVEWKNEKPDLFFFFNDEENGSESGLEPDDSWHVFLPADGDPSSSRYGCTLDFPNGKKEDGGLVSVTLYRTGLGADGTGCAGVKVICFDPATGDEYAIAPGDPNIVIEESSSIFRIKKPGSYRFRLQFTYGANDIVTAQVEFVADVLPDHNAYLQTVSRFLAAHPDAVQKTLLSSTAVDV